MKKIVPIMAGSILALAFILLIIVLISVVYPFKTSDLFNLRIEKVENTKRYGKVVTVAFDYCKYTTVPADFSVELVPLTPGEMNLVYQLQSGKVNSPTGCHKTIKRIVIPCEVPPSDYKIRLTLIYEINPVRTIARVFETSNSVHVDFQKENGE